MPATQIQLKHVKKSYGGQNVLADVNLCIEPAEFVAIVGRSGSGKSTLLRVTGALELPDSGAVLHNQIDIAAMNEAALATFRRSGLGFVFQAFNLIETLTAHDNIALPLVLNGHSANAVRTRIDELARELDIAGCESRYPDELSGGEQQRVAIARAIAHRPGIVIADEPTGNLDLDTAREVLALLCRMCRTQETTLLIATHSDEAIESADRVLRLVDGVPVST